VKCAIVKHLSKYPMGHADPEFFLTLHGYIHRIWEIAVVMWWVWVDECSVGTAINAVMTQVVAACNGNALI